jgi:hypothetical protein
MQFKFSGDKKLLEQIAYLQKNCSVDGKTLTKKEVIIDSIQMFYQMNALMDQGYKLHLVDKNGKKHSISKRKKK